MIGSMAGDPATHRTKHDDHMLSVD